MKKCYWVLLILICCAQDIFAARTVQRFVLVAGANFGGDEREPLRYAVSDAERFLRILDEMGGVDEGNQVILREPSVDDFRLALLDLRDRVMQSSRVESRAEVVLYYSGHADEDGLLLGEDRLTYRRLRDAMDLIQADVHITVLDACASGAITRLKGGQRQKAFMVDTSSDMRGYAFLTSSSENEAAQESDRIRGSFFTHYLVSGLRGAADVTGDGKVTLSEAYAFAFRNTLKRTEKTQGGAQHPAYDIKMTGTGDVVMTDVRETSASLLLDEVLNGRLFVRNTQEQLVAELDKTAGQTLELGLEPGVYDIHFEQRTDLLHAKITLKKGERFLLGDRHFQSQKREKTTSRGSDPKKPKPKRFWQAGYPHKLSGSIRIERSLGIWDPGEDSKAWIFGFWPTEHVSINYARSSFVAASVADSAKTGVSSEIVSLRIYLPLNFLRSPLRPYAEGGVGRYTGKVLDVDVDEVKGLYWGGGLDIPFMGSFALGGRVGYNHFIEPFSVRVDGRTDYSGMEYSVGLSWLVF
ncbi:MAG: caspase family protein [Candidatus Latescibacteria bacterium]|jgi:hypothetical protein|nr:caspase family protein [Candidatus Latescibacterota bacterium]